MRFMRYTSCPLLWMVSWNESIVNAPHLSASSDSSHLFVLQIFKMDQNGTLNPWTNYTKYMKHLQFSTAKGISWYLMLPATQLDGNVNQLFNATPNLSGGLGDVRTTT